MDFISAQVDQIDTGKEVSLIHYLPSAMFLKLKYQEKGTMSNVSQRFVKAPVAGPHLYLFPSLLKAALRGIYTVRAVLSSLNFPYLTPVSVPEGVLFTAKGNFQRPHPTLPQGPAGIFQLQFPSPSLLSPTLGATCCSQHSR